MAVQDLEEDDAVSMLVVGTESGKVLVLDPAGTSIQKQWQASSAHRRAARGPCPTLTQRCTPRAARESSRTLPAAASDGRTSACPQQHRRVHGVQQRRLSCGS
jgi:hypothetical protein